ncbi:TonB family protein [Ningiella sp. W23]|uniref:TonB family protein n=1 Tax=Ningiella sp. W23 TaxID=3023715 RepID=UPI003758346D
MQTFSSLNPIKMVLNNRNAFIRIGLSSLAGATTTLGLFAGMHALIENDDTITSAPTPVPIITSIMPELEETVRITQKVPPPPELKMPPKAPQVEPQAPDAEPRFKVPEFKAPVISGTLNKGKLVVNQQARPMVRVPPQYPNHAATNGIEGFVTLRFDVNASGEVENVSILDAFPKGVFNREAKKALRKWKYKAQIEQGKAVAMRGLSVTLDFKLAG